MKVVAFNGSPKKEGNTYHGLKMVAEELQKHGLETEIIHIGNQTLKGCIGCGQCAVTHDERCILPGEEVNQWIQKMKTAEAIILASPVHFSAMSAAMKAFLDRAFNVTTNNNGMLRHKVGASLVAVRRSGGLPTFEQLNNYFSYAEMVIATANYWPVIHGTTPGEVLEDVEGRQILRILAANIAWLVQLIEYGKNSVPAPALEEKQWMNFIR